MAHRYGWSHNRDRARLLAELAPGTPCAECRRPMFPEQLLDADHSTPAVLGGQRADRLLHRACNRRRGQRLAAARTRARRAGLLPPLPPRARSRRAVRRAATPEMPEW